MASLSTILAQSRWCKIIVRVFTFIVLVTGYDSRRALLQDQQSRLFLMDKETAIDNGGINLIFYGDSILNCLRFEQGDCGGAVKVGLERFGKYHYVSWAAGNEDLASLDTRVFATGVTPVGINNDNVTVVAILIGHNGGLAGGDGMAGLNYSTEVADFYDELLQLSDKIHILALPTLPAVGSDFRYRNSGIYTAAMGYAQGLKQIANKNDRVHFVNCTAYFLVPGEDDMVNATLLPDGVHMSADGFERFADCLEPTLEKLLEPVVSQKRIIASLMDPSTVTSSEPINWGKWLRDMQKEEADDLPTDKRFGLAASAP